MLRSLISIILVLASTLAFADIAEPHYYELFETGNAHYKEGNYDSAKIAYSQIVNNGYASADLFYNYGNSFFKTGNIPAAILFFERAIIMNPSHVDAKHNLTIANSFIADKIDPIETLFISKWWNNLALSLAVDTWAWLIIIMITLACGGLTLYLTSRQSSFKQLGFFAAIACFVLVIMGFFLAQNASSSLAEPYAIIFSPSVNVKSEPDLKATVQFVIHEGLKVRVLDSEDEWSRIRLADGNSGWIPTQSIEEI